MALLPLPTNPNSKGYQEYVSRGGTGYADEGISTGTTSTTNTTSSNFMNIEPYPATTSVSNGSLDRGFTTPTLIPPIGNISSTMPIIPKGPTPTMGELPSLIIPEVDEGKILSLTQKMASPAIRALRRTTREALMRHYDNPNVSKMVARETLAGLGDSLSQALTSAGSQARGEERDERTMKYNAAITEYQAKLNKQMAVFNAAWNNYMSQYGTSNISRNIYPTTTQEDINKTTSLDMSNNSNFTQGTMTPRPFGM